MAKKTTNTELGFEGKGVAPVRIKELDRLAELYIDQRDARIDSLRNEITAKGNLLEALHKHADKLRLPDGSLVYHYDEKRISVQAGKEKLKVESVEIDGSQAVE